MGPGARTLGNVDAFVLLHLYLEEPSRSLLSYKENLFLLTGTTVSKTTINRFFLKSFPTKGGLCLPNLVPLDKFKPENIIRAQEFVQIISKISLSKIKYGDEKLLKGSEVYCRKNRQNVLTGEVPAVFTASDF